MRSGEGQTNAERSDLVQEYAQGLLDVLMSHEVLEHIPVVKAILPRSRRSGPSAMRFSCRKSKTSSHSIGGAPAYLRGRIDITLQRLTPAVERLPSHDIDAVRGVVHAIDNDRSKLANMDRESTEAIMSAGLLCIET